MKTVNVSHNVALIHYGWKDFFPISDDLKPRKTINKGLTYVSFSRTKNVGNVLNLTYMGYFADVQVGDWVVLKTTSKGTFALSEQESDSPDFYLSKGIVRFIGQIFNITSQYNTDTDGILRKSYNVLVREWSHCLNIPVRYSDELSVLSQKETTQIESVKKILEKSKQTTDKEKQFVQKFIDSNWKKYISTNLSSFEIIENILTMIGIRSKFSAEKEFNYYLTTSVLPIIPSAIYEDHIQQYEDEKYEEQFPFNTGFIYQMIGPQKWNGVNLNNNLFNPNEIDSIVDREAIRPPAFVSPSIYSEGIVFTDITSKILDTGGEYETYSDILYFDNGGELTCKPVLVVRDKPISFKSIAASSDNKQYTSKDRNFGFTYKDDIPRITLPLANIISFSVSYSIQNSYNYIQFTPIPKILKEQPNMHYALKNGRYKDHQSQRRFGGQEYVASCSEFLGNVNKNPSESEKPPKITESKNKKQTNKKEGTATKASKDNIPTTDWLFALTQKYKHYLPAKFAMPNCTVQLIDNDFPLSVGLMVRIEFGENRPTICGQIEEISYTTNINGEGKIANQTYIKLSDLLMENPTDPKILNIIPKEFARTLFIDTRSTNVDHEQFIKPRE